MSNLQLSKNLFTLRKANHLTQGQISDYLNISRQAYSNYETCNRMPDLDTLILLSKLYQITLDQLVTYNYRSEAHEQLKPCNIGLSLSTSNTIYLTEKEVSLILKYRNLSKDTCSIVDGFLTSQTEHVQKKGDDF